ncbi:TonB-dependent receptor [Sphingomonas kaistensis]|uniref:TonB-dependent receptor n=1 Tax=Sphingomonas kaistensis TaxID=298708 RepID=A0ABZ2G1K7_9SPHN
MTKTLLLASTAFFAAPLAAQEAPAPAPTPTEQNVTGQAATAAATQPAVTSQIVTDEEGEEVEEITVTGSRPRGSVIGNIPPENVLDSRDIRATGATSIGELLDSIATQTGSARGRGAGAPVVLLNGQRISGFRELRDLPPEAIQRTEILPEEVALKYGYAADQRVVNIVLRRRFDSTTVELGGRVATDGGYATGRADAGKLIIREKTRTSGNVRLEGNNPLFENERTIGVRAEDTIDSRPFRTLVGAGQTARVSGTLSRPVSSIFNGTLTGEAERRNGSSGLGLLNGDYLRRETSGTTFGLGASLNGQIDRWRLSSTANGEIVRSESETALRGDLSESTRRSLVVDATANGPLVQLPAGMANVTLKAGASALGIESKSRRLGLITPSNFNRYIAEGSANADLPLTERASAIGRLTANVNGGLRYLDDFGTLTSIGAGLNWSPAARLNLLASWTREEGAPSLQQLGDPFLETTGVPFFDARNGVTVPVTTITGGNRDLEADRRNVLKIGGNWQPFEEQNLRLRAEFVRQTIDNPQISFPAATAALEQAFPNRFQRDASLRLISVDLRPVNADRSTRETLRWGFDFTKSLLTQRPSQQTITRLVDRARQQGLISNAPRPNTDGTTPAPTVTVRTEGDAPPSPPPSGAATRGGQGGGPRFGGGGPGGGGGRFGGGRGGRLTLSATHTVTFTDELVIGPGLPVLDYLGGEALNSNGGRPRHQVEVESGYYNNGLGLRLSGDWRSGTRIASTGQDLRFSPYATFDLRAFANLGERLDLVTKVPFLRGSSVRFEVNNIFNARPQVNGASSTIPFAYQPDRLEPIGRTVGVTFRKLFIPNRFIQRAFQQRAAGGRPDE